MAQGMITNNFLAAGRIISSAGINITTTLGRWLVASVKISCHLCGDKTRDAKRASKCLGEPIGI